MEIGELLVLAHGLRRLAVDHDSAVPQRPVGAARRLLPDEPVLDGRT